MTLIICFGIFLRVILNIAAVSMLESLENGWKLFSFKNSRESSIFCLLVFVLQVCNGHFVKLLAVWGQSFSAIFLFFVLRHAYLGWVVEQLSGVSSNEIRKESISVFFVRCLHKKFSKSLLSAIVRHQRPNMFGCHFMAAFCGRMEQYSPKTSVCHTSITVLWVIWAAYRVQITLDALPLWRLGKLFDIYIWCLAVAIWYEFAQITHFIYEQSTICGQIGQFQLYLAFEFGPTIGQTGGSNSQRNRNGF